MDSERHVEERVHRPDSSAPTDVRSRQRHVRTRLYFTSESHIHSLFNVLRWGADVVHAQDGRSDAASDGVNSIFSEEARAVHMRAHTRTHTHAHARAYKLTRAHTRAQAQTRAHTLARALPVGT
eukprot:6175571-Pleurochrysis_carterae.AAC.1